MINEIINESSCIQNYCNNFTWVIFCENLIPMIEKVIGQEINGSNYQEIFHNLNDYIKIDDVILNNELYPYLSDFIENAKSHPEKMHQIIFDELLNLNDENFLKKFNLIRGKDDSNGNILKLEEYLDLKTSIHKELKNFFEKSEHELIENLNLNKKNINFIDIHDVAKNCIDLFVKFNFDSSDLNNFTKDFASRIENYLSIDDSMRANKLDIDKIFSLIYSNDQCANNLLADFDQGQNFNIKIPCNEDMPKFSLMKFKDYGDAFSTGCHAALVYAPEVSKKLFLCILDHTLNTKNDILACSNSEICIEKRFEILFEYLMDKKFQNNDEFKDFVNNSSYKNLYNDFNDYFQNYIKFTGPQIMNAFYSKHFFDESSEKFHFFNDNNFPIVNVITQTNDENIGKTWKRDFFDPTMHNKKDIFSELAL